MRRLAIVLLALVFLVAACSGGGDDEIASVGDTTFHVSDIAALFEGDTLPLDETFREALFRLMAVEALEQALAAEFGVAADPAAVAVYMGQYEQVLAQGGTPAQLLDVPGASVEMVRHDAELQALRDAAIDALLVAPETVETYFADPATLTTVCVKHILVATQEEAEAVLERLESGEDFAAVATEVSLDSAVEGDLGCGHAGGYVAEFAQAALEAPLGEYVGPVESEFGFHVLVVSERNTPTVDEYLADPEALLTSQEISDIWREWINEVLQSVEASVAEQYGCWAEIGIKAPEDCTTTTVVDE